MLYNRVFPPLETGHIRIIVAEVLVNSHTFEIGLGQEQVNNREGNLVLASRYSIPRRASD